MFTFLLEMCYYYIGGRMELVGYNDKQKEAILKTDGPILVIAGAGSGKTTTSGKLANYLSFFRVLFFQYAINSRPNIII